MDFLSFTTETLILFLRFAVLIVLYLFLWQVILVIWRDLHRPATGESGQSKPTSRLVILEGGPTSYRPGHSFPIQGSTTIGRGPDNAIVLGDSFVSTSHAIVTFRDDSWWLADLDARNGTWLNGQRIKGEAQLQPGDVITIGQVKLKLAR